MHNTKILFWNCQGVSRRRPELQNFVLEHKIDILLLNETHLTNSIKLNLPNFYSYYTNKSQTKGHPPSGGTAILINRRIIHHPVKIKTSSMTNTSVHIHLGNEELRLVAVYKNPNTSLQTTDLDALLDTSHKTIIAGDLNAKHLSWNSRINNSSGNKLSRYLDDKLNITVASPTTPTHYPNNPNHLPDILDIAIMKTGQLKFHLENFPSSLSSDHSPIIINLNHLVSLSSPPKPILFTDWEKFRGLDESTHFPPPKLASPQEIETSIHFLTNVISATLKSCSSTLTPNTQNHDLPRNIIREISFKRRLRALWQRTRDPFIKTQLNSQTSRVRSLLLSHRDKEWSNFLGSVENRNDGRSAFFKLNRRLIRKPPPQHPLKDSNGSLCYDAVSKAELFADSMEFQFRVSNTPQPLDELIFSTLSDFNNSNRHQKSIFFSPAEVRNTILKLANRSAPGPDSISNSALKHCSNKTIIHICQILNGCARLEYFPGIWKNANVVMIPKPGKDPKSPINHRPISLLNTLSKVFERLILTRLKIYTAPKIRPEQYGFREQHSTTHQLVNVLDDIICSYNLRRKTAATLLDFEKAFDKVWHPGLIFKLIKCGVPTQLIKIVNSFLCARNFQIKVGSNLSSSRNIDAGVPQGSCLSPHLFAIYINDIPCHPNSKLALFADDTLLYSVGRTNNAAIQKLQLQIDLILPWLDQWRISVNPSKTTAIIFSNKRPQHNPKLNIRNVPINWSNSIKYLGIHIDNRLNFAKHVKQTLNKARATRFLLFPMLSNKNPLSLATKIYIYKTYIRPIITYACPAWASNISKTSWTTIEAFQSTTLRQITNLPFFVSNLTIRKTTNITSLYDLSQSLTLKLKTTISTSNFSHINNMAKKRNQSYGLKRNRPILF